MTFSRQMTNFGQFEGDFGKTSVDFTKSLFSLPLKHSNFLYAYLYPSLEFFLVSEKPKLNTRTHTQKVLSPTRTL